MSAASPNSFANNWAYLKTELSWLERLLMLAIARQRKELKDLGKVARNPADRVTSHWWRGLISVTNKAYDEGPPAKKKTDSAQKVSYQAQLDDRIHATEERGCRLALPHLKTQLNLTVFEKNVVLMALAPEVNIRFGRLYHFLQTGQENSVGELPTVDLILRLLCRNELEQRQARALLTKPHSLIHKQVLQLITPPARTMLGSYVKLSDDWVNYLLADKPETIGIPALPTDTSSTNTSDLNEPPTAHHTTAHHTTTIEAGLTSQVQAPLPQGIRLLNQEIDWAQVVLPQAITSQLQTLTQQVNTRFKTSPLATNPPETTHPKTTALLIGETGTGKTTAALAIATALGHPLYHLDLDQIPPTHWPQLIEHLQQSHYPILLIKAAHKWFGRHKLTQDPALQTWFNHPSPGLILLATRYRHTIRSPWRQKMNLIVDLPWPNPTQREQLWKQAFGKQIKGLRKTDWTTLARTLKLTGGQISHIAAIAITLATAEDLKKAEIQHLQRALEQTGYQWQRKTSTRKSSSKSTNNKSDNHPTSPTS